MRQLHSVASAPQAADRDTPATSGGVDILGQCIQACREKPGIVAFPDSLDERVLEAASRLKEEGLAEPVLVASPFAVRRKMQESGVHGSGLTVVDYSSQSLLQRNADDFMAIRKEKGKPISREEAMKAMQCPLSASALMVRRGEVEVGVGGNLSSTANILRTGLALIPLSAGIKTVSSFFLMLSPSGDKQFVFADCAVVPEPSADTLADIAIASAAKARNLLQQEPRVALLSFSTKGSAKHPRAELVRSAMEKVRERAPDLLIDGEMQFDAASVPSVSTLKAPGSIIEGKANVFVFPSLEAGNIAYKMVQRLADYKAVGPFLQGFEGGWHDLSRGCSSKDIFEAAVLGICMQRGSLLN
jgi:phosphotransacetylase